MPTRSREHESDRSVLDLTLRHHACIVKRRAIQCLATLIQLLELTRNHICLVLRLRKEQLDSPERASKPSRGIQSRRERETNPASRERFAIHPRSPEQRTETDVLGLRDHSH